MSDSELSPDDIIFLCPHCEQEIVMEARGAGMTVQCPHCSGELVAPGGEAAQEEEAPQPEEPQSELFDFPLSPEAISALERSLAAVMGPIGKTLAKNAASTAESSEELMEVLLSCIPNANLQERFLWICQKEADEAAKRRDAGADATSPSSQTNSSAPAIEPAMIASATRDLANFLGPIATIMVQRTAGKVTNTTEFYERLAAQIPNGADREKFLQTAPADFRGRQ